FTNQHRDDLRYVAAWGRWHRWDGQRWNEDTTLRVFDNARDVCRSAAKRARHDEELGGKAVGIAVQLSNARTVAAVERLVRADRAHAAAIDQWDTDPHLLNT